MFGKHLERILLDLFFKLESRAIKLMENEIIATYIVSKLLIETRVLVGRCPELDIVVDTRGSEHRQKRMWLEAVDDMLVCLEQHAEFRRLAIPDEDVATVTARHDKVVAPEIGLLDHCPKETRVTHEARARYENIVRADINSPAVHFRGFACLFVFF